MPDNHENSSELAEYFGNVSKMSRDFESVASASSATPAPIQYPRETAENQRTFEKFQIVIDESTGRQCHALPYFALPKGPKKAQRKDTAGSAEHRAAIAGLVDAGAGNRGFAAALRSAFGLTMELPRLVPDAYLIDADRGLVTLFEVVVTHGISDATARRYWRLHHDLAGESIDLCLVILQLCALCGHESWDCYRLYFCGPDAESARR